jgi:TolB-like protein
VHRDLKTANLMLTAEGRVKVLDFGIARRFADPAIVPDTQLATLEPALTAGTLAYMSPEVLRGGVADRRADIWAIGVVLYELLAGRRPFQGDTSIDLSSAILRDPPPALSSQVPRAFVALIARGLEKDPARRYQRAGEVRAALEMIPADAAPGTSAPRPRQSRPPKGRSPAKSRIRAIAVLPLENLSRDHDRDVFADGMTDALINDLAQIQALRVISRTTAMRYKGTAKPIAEIARELSVDAIVEGTVLWDAGAVRIAVELVDAATDTHLWARSYEREVSSVPALQRELARAIVDEIQVTLSPDERARLQTTRAVKADAYELWLRGREFQNRWTEEGLTASVASFQRAIDRDPGWAPAHAELAESFLLMATFGVRRPADVASSARRRRPGRWPSTNRWPRPTRHWRLPRRRSTGNGPRPNGVSGALTLKPGDGTTRQLLGWLLLALGRSEESIAEQRRALHLDPLSPNVNSNLGWAFAWGGETGQAVEQLQATLRLEPSLPTAHFWLSEAYRLRSMPEEGVLECQKAVRLFGGPQMVAHLGHAYAAAGHENEARAILDDLTAIGTKRYVASYGFALIHAALKEIDEAFVWLDRACDERSWWVMWTRIDPRVEPLRADPRYQRLLSKLGLSL